MPKQLSDMEVDEISIVDVPAAQHSQIVIAKRHTPGGNTMPTYFLEDGTELTGDPEARDGDFANLAHGTTVYDDANAAYTWGPEDDEAAAAAAEPAGVAKAFQIDAPGVQGSISKALETAISKAGSLEDVKKTLGEFAGVIAEIEKRADDAETLASEEQGRRVYQEFVEVAKSYHQLPGTPEELGMAFMDMQASCQPETVETIAKALQAARAGFDELGVTMGDQEFGPADEVEGAVQEVAAVAKSLGRPLSSEVAKGIGTEEYYAANPSAYDSVLADLRRG